MNKTIAFALALGASLLTLECRADSDSSRKALPQSDAAQTRPVPRFKAPRASMRHSRAERKVASRAARYARINAAAAANAAKPRAEPLLDADKLIPTPLSLKDQDEMQ